MTYGVPQIATLVVLAGQGGESTLADLGKIHGVNLAKKARDKLEADGLITARRETKPQRTDLTLTDAGWALVEDLMTAAPDESRPPRAGALWGAMHSLLAANRAKAKAAGGLRALWGEGADSPGPSATGTEPGQAPSLGAALPDGDLPLAIRAAYRALAAYDNGWVLLRDLRPKLAQWSRRDVDEALKEMRQNDEIDLETNDDAGAVTEADRNAAIRIGLTDMHFVRCSA